MACPIDIATAMEQRLSWGANRSSYKESACILSKPKAHYRVNNSS